MARRAGHARPEQLTLDDWAATTVAVSRSDPTRPAGHVRQQESPAPPAAHHQHAADLLETPGALLTRTHLRELGLERRAVDAVFRKLRVVSLPGYSRPLIRAEEYLHLIDDYTYGDDRVRPVASSASG
jgi:hypothetical protein